MAQLLACDGCLTPIGFDTPPRGQLAKTFYCPTCADLFEQATREIDAERVRLVAAFEAFRTARLATLRETVKALPDS